MESAIPVIHVFRPIRELCPFANWMGQFANFERFANWGSSMQPCQSTRFNPTKVRELCNKDCVRPVISLGCSKDFNTRSPINHRRSWLSF